MQQIDRQQYSNLKRQLPYLVCGTFNPPFRRSENFAAIEHFIVDIDHLSEKQIDAVELKERLRGDRRIEMAFLSPGGDGLKLLLKLSGPCHDKGMFSIFYKSFCSRFATHCKIDQVIDTRTSDVTRACFLSYDPDAWFNPQAETVDMSHYLDPENTLTLHTGAVKQMQPADTIETTAPSPTVIDNIKQILELNRRKSKTEKAVYVPEQLNEIIESLKSYIEQSGAIVKNIANIQYGKKIQCTIGLKQTETNLFYGKRGFSVVISPRTGTDTEANQLVAELIESFLLTKI